MPKAVKKYEIPLALASARDDQKLALARMILDMLELDEIYAKLETELYYEEIQRMEEGEIFEILGIDFGKRSEKLDSGDILKSYDLALALATAGKIDEARKVMESINPKQELSDFLDTFRYLEREVRTTVYLDRDLLKTARKSATDLGVSFSALLEEALRHYVEKIKKKEEKENE